MGEDEDLKLVRQRVGGKRFRRSKISGPGVVDYNIEKSGFGLRGIECALDRIGIGQVELHSVQMRQLRDATTDPKFDYFKRQLDQQMQAASAWVAYGEGKKEDAVDLLRRTADAEDILGKHPVSPGALVPAREQLGDLLLKLDRPKEAQREFEAALKIYPGRFRGLYGAALAAEQIGEKEKAHHYYAKLTEQTEKADGSRSELAQLRESRAAENATTQPRSATEPRK